MPEPPVPEVWASLRARVPSYGDSMAVSKAAVDPSGRDLLYAMDCGFNLHLLVPVSGEPPVDMPPDLQGLKVRHRRVDGELEYLDLESAARHESLFSPFCGEVLSAVVGQARRPWEAVASTIRAWQSAWRPLTPEMAKIVQVGLFGELLTLEEIVIPAIGPAGVRHWSGPSHERHDFVGPGLALEVKSTRKSRHEHEISRLDQLHVPRNRKLLLISLLLEESAEGRESLATRMDAISAILRTDPEASDLFQAAMVKMGWSEEMRRSGNLLRFNFRESRICEVDGNFPRLSEDFTPPSGVVAVRYTIDMANLPSMDIAEAVAMVRNGFKAS